MRGRLPADLVRMGTEATLDAGPITVETLRPETPIRLAPSPLRHRISHRGVAVVVILTFVLLAWGVIGSTALAPHGTHPVAIAVATVVTLGLLLLSIVFARSLWRSVGGGSLRFDGVELAIGHPAFFKEPIHVRSDAIRKIVVDDGIGPGTAVDYRFPIHDDGPEVDAALWAERDPPSPLPYLDLFAEEPPNVAIVFERPVPAAGLKRVVNHGPLKGEHLAGVLLRADSASEARAQVGSSNLLGSLNPEDLDHLMRGLGFVTDDEADGPQPVGPETPPRKHSRATLLRRQRRIWTFIGIVFLVWLTARVFDWLGYWVGQLF
jgi:hypothetical protein